MFSREYEERLIQKAIGLQVLQRKYSKEDGRTLTRFDPRFLELVTEYANGIIQRGGTGRDFNEMHMGALVGRYTLGHPSPENRQKLDKLVDQSFRDMCIQLMMNMAQMDAKGKLKDYR